MANIIKKVEAKLGDHPNASADPNVNPTSGTGKGANDGNDPHKSFIQNKIEAGQGNGSDKDSSVRAGSTTSGDTVSAGSASGALGGRDGGL